MPYSSVVKSRRDGKITLKDGTGSPVTLIVEYEEGNLSFEQPLADQTVIRDRSVIANVRKGDDQPITGTFSFYFRQFTDAANPGSVRDFITGSGNYSANISTGATGSPYVEEFAHTISFLIEGTDLGDASDHEAVFSKCVSSLSFAEGESDTWTLSFTCYGGIVYT
jgi:hypothetical protein